MGLIVVTIKLFFLLVLQQPILIEMLHLKYCYMSKIIF